MTITTGYECVLLVVYKIGEGCELPCVCLFWFVGSPRQTEGKGVGYFGYDVDGVYAFDYSPIGYLQTLSPSYMDPSGSELDSSLPQPETPCLIVEDSQPDSLALEDDPESSYRALLAKRLSNLQPPAPSPVLVSGTRFSPGLLDWFAFHLIPMESFICMSIHNTCGPMYNKPHNTILLIQDIFSRSSHFVHICHFSQDIVLKENKGLFLYRMK